MTEEQIKEQLSRGFIRLVANRAGYKCKIDETDHGVDITLAEVIARLRPTGSYRLTETGRYVDLQLKCTTEASVTRGATTFKFDLESKTYNDLVSRLDDPNAAPLFLVVFILPEAKTEWLEVSPDELTLRRGAFWWRPAPGTPMTHNIHQIRIEVPYTNHVGLAFAAERYAECYP